MTGRPKTEEAPDSFHKYIDQIAGEDVIAVLEAQIAEMKELGAQVSEERSLTRYAEGKWSVREALSHITDTERIFAFRALWFARGFTDALPSFDQHVGVAGAQADRLAWATHVEEFVKVREATLVLFRNLPDQAWSRSGVASWNMVSVRAIAFMIAGHAAHHVTILRERYLG